jgi:hypothetical protein
MHGGVHKLEMNVLGWLLLAGRKAELIPPREAFYIVPPLRYVGPQNVFQDVTAAIGTELHKSTRTLCNDPHRG